MASTNLLLTRATLLYISFVLMVAVHFDLFKRGPIPILTPLSHHLATLLSPFTTCVGPLCLLAAIRYSTHAKWRHHRRSRQLVFLVVVLYSVLALLAYAALRRTRSGVRKALSHGEWWWKVPVEAALLVLVVVGERNRAVWDGGYINRVLDGKYEKMSAMEEEKRLEREARDLKKRGGMA
ncbi:hypothetical protein VE01_05568 [Pseudogymnoascus verrucosus]|uniref:Uncharacterized protein n=1 Tax=Pseudogymnoascus verrucosus TaxID=342668 RepID=A0A1B8GM90_9PEZI|nr:uncharacterized protein VE01_05568 [Pseudogymnoascus verrucosus]OBT96950.1 hypothetical protein VE01_05568 [Pseudogymnoascus verrucosus]